MNEQIRKLAIDAGLINYIDNETPRHYFVDAGAEIQDVEEFAKLLIRDIVSFCAVSDEAGDIIKKHFGVEE